MRRWIVMLIPMVVMATAVWILVLPPRPTPSAPVAAPALPERPEPAGALAPEVEFRIEAITVRLPPHIPPLSETGNEAPKTRELEPIEFTVLVVHPDGLPIRGAAVEVWKHGPRRGGRARVGGTVFTDHRGRAPVTLDHLESYCLASAYGATTESVDRLNVKHRLERDGLLILELRVPAKVRGLVLRADGSPAPSVEVLYKYGCHSKLHVVLTDFEGRFEIEIAPRCEWNFWVRDGDSSFLAGRLTPRPAQEIDMTIRTPGAYVIRGVLLDTGGAPAVPPGNRGRIAGVTAYAVELTSYIDVGKPERFAGYFRIEEDGRFRAVVPGPGTYWVGGNVAGEGESLLEKVIVDEPGSGSEITLRLQPKADISGHAYLEGDGDLAGTRLYARPEVEDFYAPAARGLALEFHGWMQARTSSSGEIHFSGVHSALRYTIGIRNDFKDRILARHVEPGTATLRLGLDPRAEDLGTIVAEIVSDATGRPVTRFRFHLEIDSDLGGWQELSRDIWIERPGGVLEFDDLPRGFRYRASATAEGFGWAVVEPIVLDAASRRIVFRLPQSTELIVRVRDEAGFPASNALVYVEALFPQPIRFEGNSFHTDDEGRVVFPDRSPGRYRVRARRGPLETQRTVHVEPGPSEEIEIVLKGR